MPEEKEITLPVENTEDDSDDPQNVRYEITSFPTDFTVKVMYQKWTDKQLVIPEFQRHYVWNLPQASRLIESFLLGLPIPQVFLYRERNDPKLLVVDGHQRLATIAMFYQERFVNGRLFRLSGVDSRWNLRTYTELSEDDRLVLDDSTLRSIVIQQTQPDDNSSVYQIFERLNTGGTQLSAMEIRKAIFHGQAFDFVEKLNRVESWRQLLGSEHLDRRLRDVELVARVLALVAGWKQYKTPMKTFITDYMAELKVASPGQLSRLRKRFVTACDTLAARLSPQPFHLRKRLNVAALDSVVGAAILLGPRLREDLKRAYRALIHDPEFLEVVDQHTSDALVVHARFSLVRSRLRRDD